VNVVQLPGENMVVPGAHEHTWKQGLQSNVSGASVASSASSLASSPAADAPLELPLQPVQPAPSAASTNAAEEKRPNRMP
jgi:hypothetical protein